MYRAKLTPELGVDAGWDAQAETLLGVYRSVLRDPDSIGHVHVKPADIQEPDRHELWGVYRPWRLAIGPRNMAGQAHRIAQAVNDHLGIESSSFALENGKFDFPVDHLITKHAWFDPAWQTHQVRLLSSSYTHVLAESGTGMYGAMNGGFIDEQLQLMQTDHLEVGVLLHGSEIRDPRRHKHLPFSPYATDHQLIRDLEQATARLRTHLEGLKLPFFVTTPDLREDIDAIWVPVVIEPEGWRELAPAFDRDLPVVLHMPTSGLLKGSDHVDEVLFKLRDEGLIEYLRPTEFMSPAEVAKVIEQADVVIDGIVLGAYGVMSCQAMAAGRIAIANTRDLGSLGAECPIVDASPSTLNSVIRELLSDQDAWAAIVADGQKFIDTYHDGHYSAAQLTRFLGA
jgi:hypothetical protein